GANGDVLDVNDLLRNAALGFDGSNPFAGGYLRLVQSDADTLVQFDADGAAGAAKEFVTIAVLRNVDSTQLGSANFTPNYPPDGSDVPGQLVNGGDA
ncbi:type I secretion C-terminal target domain-containing protein, partial [Azohydromonas lata]